MARLSRDVALKELRNGFAGVVLERSSAGYDEARAMFNAMIDLHPAVIAQCATVEDVVRALRCARELDLEVAVRGGGHSVAGMGSTDSGFVIDLRRMNRVTVDPDERLAMVGGGATMSHLDRATEQHGLATTGGRVSTTGVGGLVLGGGGGWLDRKMGLACDNLVAVELVTADGEHIRASTHEHPDLFWALHGGGGNFGIATQLTLALHPLPVVTAALLVWPPAHGRELVRAYRDFMDRAPDDVGGGLLYLTAPPEPFVPDDLVGELACAILLVYAGEEDDARAVWAPMLALGHVGELLVEVPYAELQCMLDDPPGYRNYWTAEYLEAFPDEAVERFCARAGDMVVPSPSQHALFAGGGAVARGPADYPVPWRHAPWVVHPFGLWEDPADDARGRQWARDIRADLAPWATGAVYLNFIGDEGLDRLVAGFGPEAYRRLAQVKAAYDPDNVFHRNHNIAPAVAGSW